MSQPGEDYYDDSSTPPAASGDKAPEKGGDDDGGKTSILPRSFFAGKDLKVGDKCDVTVTAIHENDVEVEPCESDDKEDEGDQPPETEAAPPKDSASDDGSMASMMQ